jgi:predicted RNA-binding protein (virulence factor B family)
VDSTASKLLSKLKENNGFLPFGDKSSPEDIMRVFGMSKKTFKMTLGKLFKEGKVKIEEDGIRLVPKWRK